MPTGSPLDHFRHRLTAALVQALGIAPESIKLERPRDPAHGDFAFPCFQLAKERKQAPPALAAEIAGKLAGLEHLTAKTAGPFLNFTIDRAELARRVLTASFDPAYGGGDEGAGKTIVLDYSSPNIAKRFHIGHLRSTVIGMAIRKMCEARGFRVVGINHIGDWGSQFGKLLTALRRYSSEAALDAAAATGTSIEHLHEIYVRYHEDEDKGGDLAKELAAEARKWFLDLESGAENEARRLWKKMTTLSLAEFERIYRRLGVTFTEIRGESAYEPDLAPTIRRIKEAGVTRISEGALVVDVEGSEKPALLQTGDGTTLYLTRDLASVFYRKGTYNFWKAVYVVGSDQRDHFRELKLVVKRLGLEWWDDIEHAYFGMMRLPEGKMSSRKGRVVILEDVLDSAVEQVRTLVREKNPNLQHADEVAEQVGIGAVVFNDLKNDRRRDVVFSWQEVLNFDGETGPYCQYTHARLASIVRKSGQTPSADVDPALAGEGAQLLLAIGRFPETVALAAERFEPHLLAGATVELAQLANAYYRDHRVLDAGSPQLVAARLALVEAARRTLARALALLGIAAPAEM